MHGRHHGQKQLGQARRPAGQVPREEPAGWDHHQDRKIVRPAPERCVLSAHPAQVTLVHRTTRALFVRRIQRATTDSCTNIQAGSIEITARETDINMTGAKLQARDISLDAKRDINLLAAQNTAATAGNSSGRSLGGGVTFGFGSQNGFSIQVNAGSNQGKSIGNEVRYDNTLVTATDTLKIKSGGDVNMRGAQVAGDTVKADIGGNLNIESLQDITNYASQQSSGGVNVSLCIPG
ncbi:hemagglutinin repeat-containing protein [Variovorax sp. CF079]|uniref:hemagglutinin repeat-containing protein n=1 Tax=Variovorax sp. CF079 TaxID=1882774 RepID=UPI000B87CA22